MVRSAYKDANFVFIAVPINYDPKKNFFYCSVVEAVIELVLKVNPTAIMVMKGIKAKGATVMIY